MAREVAALGLGRLGLAGLVARTLPTNRASRRVMEKVGFGYERDTVHAGLTHVLYRLPAPRREGPRERGEAV
jgi:[ribosomal protein S5]-alanine N-acetyltransferase